MASWTELLNSIFLVGKPITSSTGLALRDNAIAISEGHLARHGYWMRLLAQRLRLRACRGFGCGRLKSRLAQLGLMRC